MYANIVISEFARICSNQMKPVSTCSISRSTSVSCILFITRLLLNVLTHDAGCSTRQTARNIYTHQPQKYLLDMQQMEEYHNTTTRRRRQALWPTRASGACAINILEFQTRTRVYLEYTQTHTYERSLRMYIHFYIARATTCSFTCVYLSRALCLYSIGRGSYVYSCLLPSVRVYSHLCLMACWNTSLSWSVVGCFALCVRRKVQLNMRACVLQPIYTLAQNCTRRS